MNVLISTDLMMTERWVWEIILPDEKSLNTGNWNQMDQTA